MSQYGPPPDQPDPNQPPQDPYGAPPPPNPYGAPPPANPYGAPQQDPYGAPPQNPQAPYGGTPNPYGGSPNAYAYASGGSGNYASWIARVGAYVVDYVLAAIAGLPLWIGYGILIAGASTTTDPVTGTKTTHMDGGGASLILILLGLVTYVAFWIWNVCIKQGKSGQTIGKGLLAIRLVGRDGQPIGGGLCFVRQLAHILDGIVCYIGYLWPLWDSKKQTFADKIMGTVVINATAAVPQA
jgi:uncharacterized RDD family membrane protein YckC